MKKNKAKVVEQEKKYVYLTYTEHQEGGEVEDPDDRWSNRTDLVIDWTLTGCELIQQPWPVYTERVEVNFDVKPGDGIWVVYVRYGTGDTFGHTDGAWQIIGVYEHQDQASKIVKSIHDGTYNKDGYNCWDGYFESLQSCDAQGMIVKGEVNDWSVGAFKNG